MAARRAARDPGDAAVSDIVGSILLVAMTVLMAVALGALLLSFDGPADTQYTNLGASLDPGPDGQWNSGNEEIRLTHLGGEPLKASGTTIKYTLGTTTTALSGGSLGSAFGDGKLTIGERWVRTASFALNDLVQVRVSASTADSTQLLANVAVVAGSTTVGNLCLGDNQSPTASFVQKPGDVDSLTVGAILVNATVADNCSGVAAALAPQLWYCVSASCPAPSVAGTGYTAVTMTRPNPGALPLFWQASIPGPLPLGAWSSQVGKTLTYYVYPLTDSATPANTGFSATRTDPVTLFTQYKPVESHIDTIGSATSFSSMAADDGAEGSLNEGVASGSSGTLTLNASAVTSSSGWNTANSAIGSNNVYATDNDNNPSPLQLAYTDPSSNPGAISQVVVRAEVSLPFLGTIDDGFQLQACLGGVCNAASSAFTATVQDAVISYDVTAVRPGGGTWSWSDINNLEIRIAPFKTSSRDGTWQVDHATASISYLPTYGMNIKLNFGAVQSGTVHTLQMEYHLGTGSNSYNIEFGTNCSPTCTWTALGSLSSTTLATYTHVFSGPEITANYQVRIVTPSASQDTTQSQLFIDYAWVATTG